MNKSWAIGAVCALLIGCASRDVREPPAPLVDFEPSYRVREAWSTDVGGASKKGYLRLMPTVAEGYVYAADAEGRVSAMAADSGRRHWSVDLQTPVSGAVGVGETQVLIGTRRGQVIALARESGKQNWTAPVSSEVLAAPAEADGVVVAQTIDGRVFGLSAEDGKRLWVYERSEPALSLRGTARPLLVSGAVLAGFASGKLVALRLRDGGVLWEATVSQPRGRNEIERLVDVDAAPIVAQDTVYAASYQGKLAAIDPRTGNVLWSRDVSTYTGLATDGTNIYVTDEKSQVLAFDRRSGAILWKQDRLRGRGLSAPTVQGDIVVVADAQGYVHWLAREDGRFLARHRLDSDPIRAAAVAAGDFYFVADVAGTLAALRLQPK